MKTYTGEGKLRGLVVVADSSPDYTCQLSAHAMEKEACHLNTRGHLTPEETGNSEERRKGNVYLCMCLCDTVNIEILKEAGWFFL